MKTKIAIAMMLAFTGSAFAQPAKGDAMKKAPDASKPAPPADNKKAPAADPKAPTQPPPAAAMTQPKPPTEVADMAKAMGGNWKCTGKGVMDPMKPTEMSEFKGTYKASLDNSLDKFWVKGEWTGTSGKIKMKGLMYMTYDAASKKWNRVMVDNMGMSGTETSTGMPAGAKEGTMVWEGESRMMGQTIKGKTTEDVKAKEVTMKMEMSPDGKKWMTGMEMTCKK
jgi:hypothetical protein